MRMKSVVFTLAALALGLPAVASAQDVPRGAGMPPSAAYKCMTLSGSLLFQMGTFKIAGTSYQFAPTGGKFGRRSRFSMDANNHLHWHGPVGALTIPPARITDSWLERGTNYLSVIVKYKPEPNGYILTMGCRNDLH